MPWDPFRCEFKCMALVLFMAATAAAASGASHVPTPVANRPLLVPSSVEATLQVARVLAGADNIPKAVSELEGLASAHDLEEWAAVPAIAVAVYVALVGWRGVGALIQCIACFCVPPLTMLRGPWTGVPEWESQSYILLVVVLHPASD